MVAFTLLSAQCQGMGLPVQSQSMQNDAHGQQLALPPVFLFKQNLAARSVESLAFAPYADPYIAVAAAAVSIPVEAP